MGLPASAGVEEGEGDPMTTVWVWGDRGDSCPARLADVVLDTGVAAGAGVGGSKVTTPGGWPRDREVDGAGKKEPEGPPPPDGPDGLT
jgi:hypothetical protein